MAGGRWINQNKVRPGAYVNVDSNGAERSVARMRGVVALPWEGDFGPIGKVIAVNSQTDFLRTFGYELQAQQMVTIREALKRAATVLVYRVNGHGGAKAEATIGDMRVIAQYPGTRGNDIRIVVEDNLDNVGYFNVRTFIDNIQDGQLLGTAQIDNQLARSVEDLTDNAFVTFVGEGSLAVALAPGNNLTGGDQAKFPTVADYEVYFEKMEHHEFNTMALPVTDSGIREMGINFIARQRDEEGKKCQLVVASAPAVDNEAVINVINGVVLHDGTRISAPEATAWVAGATAGADVNQSNTYTAYDGAIDLIGRYANTAVIDHLRQGHFLFTEQNGRIVVEQDINSLHNFSDERNQSFSKNRVIRVLDDLANNIRRLFALHFIGQVTNDDNGRAVFKVAVIEYMSGLQNMGAIENFSADDIQIEAGRNKDSIVVNLQVQSTDAMEKLYMSVEVQ